MQDEQLYKASVKVASALLIELPLARTWNDLTYHVLFCILTIGIAIQFERSLLE